MPYTLEDTIVAVASPPGGGVRGIIRLAGPRVGECLARCFLPQADVFEGIGFLLGKKTSPMAVGAKGIHLANEAGRLAEMISEKRWEAVLALFAGLSKPGAIPGELQLEGFSSGLPCEVYWQPGPRSYTGGPSAEIHTLGCVPLLEAAVRTLCQAGARLAEPGEFTLRAFLSGRIDLTQAEAVLGVVDAVDSQQLAAALEQLAGGLSRPLQELRNRLFDLLVHLEAGLDFPEEDLPFLTRRELAAQMEECRQDLQRLAKQLQTRRTSEEGVTVVLVGRPNVGKSSLFNALLRRPQAIVSPWPGTTRDYLVGELDLAGVRCRLVDTAGLDWVRISAGQDGAGEDPQDAMSVEAASEQMTVRQLQEADVWLWCVDASQPRNAEEWARLAAGEQTPRLAALTKADQPIQIDLEEFAALCGRRPILVSSRTGQGLDELRTRLRETIEGLATTGGHAVGATAIRAAESIRLAEQALQRAIALSVETCPEELIAAEVHLALEEIGKVSGAVYTEDLLDRIFSRFCIGK